MNERRLQPSAGGSLHIGIRLHQYKICKNKIKTIATGGFHPHWVSTLYLVFRCVIVCSVFTAPGYCLYGSDAQINDQHLNNNLNYKSAGYTLVSLTTVVYIRSFH